MTMARRSVVTALTVVVSGVGFGAGTANTVRAPDGVPIHLLDRGRGEPALVFVGGWGAEIADWDPQIEYFAKSHRVVAIDLPGFGRSGNDRERWTMAAYGDDVAAVMVALDVDRAILVGHSMGAAVVLEAAMTVPDRVLGLVPVDVFHDVETQLSADEIRQRVDRMMRSVDDVPKIGWREAAAEYFRWRNGLTEILPTILPPIHCINSDRFETDFAKAQKYAPSYDATVIAGVGHAVMTDAPTQFNQVLESIIAGFAPS